ncbi:unnamed protein product [Calypogeia fissa]
MELAELEGY